MTNKNELIKKIDDKTTLSESEIERSNLVHKSPELLSNFLITHFQRITSENTLLNKIEGKFLDSIIGESDEELPMIALVKIYEILKKSQSDVDSAILQLYSKNPKVFGGASQEELNKAEDSGTMTQDEIIGAKKLLGLLNKLDISEN